MRISPTEGTMRAEKIICAQDLMMSRKGMMRMSPPMKNITNPMTQVSEQVNFNKAGVSQKM